MTPVTCRLTAKNRDQLRNPTLGNRVWATFTFYYKTGSLIQVTMDLNSLMTWTAVKLLSVRQAWCSSPSPHITRLLLTATCNQGWHLKRSGTQMAGTGCSKTFSFKTHLALFSHAQNSKHKATALSHYYLVISQVTMVVTGGFGATILWPAMPLNDRIT